MQILALPASILQALREYRGFSLWKKRGCSQEIFNFFPRIATCYTLREMRFRGLQENLRKTLQDKIAAGELTGLRIAEQAGFRQAHISNFLNHKRSLSMNALDRVLNTQRLSVFDLLDPHEVNKRAGFSPPSDDEFENVAVVGSRLAATQPLIMTMHVREIHKFKRSSLRKLRAGTQGNRRDWERFVAIRADADSMSMHPRLTPGAVVVIDRHYNSLVPYRKGEINMYAVEVQGTCKVRYVELAGSNLVLRPHNQSYPIEVFPLEKGKRSHEYIVGRVCHVGMDV